MIRPSLIFLPTQRSVTLLTFQKYHIFLLWLNGGTVENSYDWELVLSNQRISPEDLDPIRKVLSISTLSNYPRAMSAIKRFISPTHRGNQLSLQLYYCDAFALTAILNKNESWLPVLSICRSEASTVLSRFRGKDYMATIQYPKVMQ